MVGWDLQGYYGALKAAALHVPGRRLLWLLCWLSECHCMAQRWLFRWWVTFWPRLINSLWLLGQAYAGCALGLGPSCQPEASLAAWVLLSLGAL